MRRSLRFLLLAALASSAPGLPVGAAPGAPGNGAPNGAHYSLNILGVSNPKTSDMTGSQGHVIFVNLVGKSKISLCEAGVDTGCEDVQDFQVLDANGTDANGALFALPNPDPDGDGTTTYSVFARALGTPGGSSKTTTCATDPGDDLVSTADDTLVCSALTLTLTRDPGRSRFDNVTKYLLYIYQDVDGDTIPDRVPLFDDSLRGYYWDYDNTGLKLAQLRFYQCATIVPDPTDPNGAQLDTSCFAGKR